MQAEVPCIDVTCCWKHVHQGMPTLCVLLFKIMSEMLQSILCSFPADAIHCFNTRVRVQGYALDTPQRAMLMRAHLEGLRTGTAKLPHMPGAQPSQSQGVM